MTLLKEGHSCLLKRLDSQGYRVPDDCNDYMPCLVPGCIIALGIHRFTTLTYKQRSPGVVIRIEESIQTVISHPEDQMCCPEGIPI